MEAKLVRDELEKCHRAESVNHYENCKWLSDKYLQMLRENKVCLLAWCMAEHTSHLICAGQVQGYKTIDT